MIYKLILLNNTGSFAADAIATSVGGSFRDCVTRYNGEHDLAFIDCPDDNSDHLESLLDANDNIVSYSKLPWLGVDARHGRRVIYGSNSSWILMSRTLAILLSCDTRGSYVGLNMRLAFL